MSNHAARITAILRGHQLMWPGSYNANEFTPAEEAQAEREQAERDELEDRAEEIHEPTEDER